MKYKESDLNPELLRAIEEMGFEEMTPIQKEAIPVLLEGKDVIGQAQTGTGKTAAFGIPLVLRMNPKDRRLQGVVLCPTRELAIQAADEIRRFAKFMHGVRVLPVYGGQEIYKQIKALKGGVQIIVGTPGRVMDHMRRRTIRMDAVRMVVLDEADEMLNMGFREDMETILKEIDVDHQTALFSATMPQPILDITGTYQKEDAVMIRVVKEELTIPLVEQTYYFIRRQYKEEVTARLLEYHALHRSLIFCNTKKMVDELADNLKKRGFSAEGLHGDLSQHQRDVVMNRFRSGSLEVLIATDVAARGIDVDDVEAVINYDIPQDIEYYVHRIGRTGRAGKECKAFTLVSGREIYKIREIERICKTKMKEESVPAAGAITSLKAGKILQEAEALLADQKSLKKMKKILEKYSEEGGYELLDLAAALLRIQTGEEKEEIEDLCEPVRRRERGQKERSGIRGRKGGESDRRRKAVEPGEKKHNQDKRKKAGKGFMMEKPQRPEKAKKAGKAKDAGSLYYSALRKKGKEKNQTQPGRSGFRRERSGISR